MLFDKSIAKYIYLKLERYIIINVFCNTFKKVYFSMNYSCDLCSYYTIYKNHFTNHNVSMKHKKAVELHNHFMKKVYRCNICKYATNVKFSWYSHTISRYHIDGTGNRY